MNEFDVWMFAVVAKWQTRMLELHVPVRVWRFKSSLDRTTY